MANYTLAINWSGKDALSDTHPSKVISGTDFNTEFTTVKTAINTKADLNGAASEAFSVITEAVSSNTTVAASTAYVTRALVGHDTKIDIMKAVYPLGSIFTTVSDTNALATTAAEVATLMGFGTWVPFGRGEVLVGLDDRGTTEEPVDFDTVEDTGGAKTHTLTTEEIPSHNHANNLRVQAGDNTLVDTSLITVVAGGDALDHLNGNYPTSTDTGLTGGVSDSESDDYQDTVAHNNLQPYVVVYMWKRTV